MDQKIEVLESPPKDNLLVPEPDVLELSAIQKKSVQADASTAENDRSESFQSNSKKTKPQTSITKTIQLDYTIDE